MCFIHHAVHQAAGLDSPFALIDVLHLNWNWIVKHKQNTQACCFVESELTNIFVGVIFCAKVGIGSGQSQQMHIFPIFPLLCHFLHSLANWYFKCEHTESKSYNAEYIFVAFFAWTSSGLKRTDSGMLCDWLRLLDSCVRRAVWFKSQKLNAVANNSVRKYSKITTGY